MTDQHAQQTDPAPDGAGFLRASGPRQVRGLPFVAAPLLVTKGMGSRPGRGRLSPAGPPCAVHGARPGDSLISPSTRSIRLCPSGTTSGTETGKSALYHL